MATQMSVSVNSVSETTTDFSATHRTLDTVSLLQLNTLPRVSVYLDKIGVNSSKIK